jgi:transcription-repair coupling factor (superfamily II helicase)
MAGHDFQLPDLGDLANALRGNEPSLAVGGITPGARPLVLAALLHAGWPTARCLVVVPHVGDAADFVAGLRLLHPEIRVARVPPEGAEPYRGTEPPLASRHETVRLLGRLAAGGIDVLVAPVRALAMPIPVPADVVRQSIEVAKGRPLDTSELCERLAAAGYRRVDLVEETGEFAVRGWVVDIHPGTDNALRLGLDDQEVDDIRPFDPATQRSCGEPLDRFTFPPLDPFPAHPERLAAVAAELEEEYPALAENVLTGSERRIWWGAMHLTGDRSSWFDEVHHVVVCDRDEVLGEMGRWWKVQEREWRTLAGRTMDLPPPDRLLIGSEELGEGLERSALRVERLEIGDSSSRWWRLSTHPTESFARRIPDLVPTIRHRRGQDFSQVLVVASDGERRRFDHLLTEGEVVSEPAPPSPGGVSVVIGGLQQGFRWDGGLVVYGRRDLTATPPPRRRAAGTPFVSDLRDLRPNDLVVHMDHGIGRFEGFRRVSVEGRAIEMLVVSYRGGDSLLVPVDRADLIQKYSSGESDGAPRLDRLGGSTWRRRTARVRRAVRELAAELLRLAAVRSAVTGHSYSPDSPWQREFEDAFEHELTADQERAISEIKTDMESPRPMDRLLCGDVGYGKTEVAIRAAFKAVLEGKQVAVLAPTTILAEQHLHTFTRRLAGFPVETSMLSRFSSPADAKDVLAGLADGRVDIVIGTHRLLSDDVGFRDLGLLVLDEEQRFGVAQKEKLKRLKTEVDMVAMSATPIPRTLNMALGGLRDISLIETPPRDRQAVETSVLEFSEEVVREAILFEMERSGQIYFVHNRVRSIGAFAEWLQRTVPEARIVVAHGQMSERSLERAMRAFLDGDADVLLATAIIENGLDIPNANTLLVNRADRFGLAQLYQLRGRVGRSDRLAFAQFLVPPGRALSETARARLAAIQEFCELGAGFRIAARDLEIRGAGNLLGAEQHGFMEAVGYETYCRLLEEAVAELEGRRPPVSREVELRLGLDLQLPDSYIPEPALRLSFYKRLASTDGGRDLDLLIEEVVDRYGPAPAQLERIVKAQRARVAAQNARMTAVSRRGGRWRLRLDPDEPPSDRLSEALAGWPDARISPSGEITLPIEGDPDLDHLIDLLRVLAVQEQ